MLGLRAHQGCSLVDASPLRDSMRDGEEKMWLCPWWWRSLEHPIADGLHDTVVPPDTKHRGRPRHQPLHDEVILAQPSPADEGIPQTVREHDVRLR